jgi:hypothetical protein
MLSAADGERPSPARLPEERRNEAMRATARRVCVAAILLIVALSVSGCICGPGWWRCARHHPRRAALHVHVYDYYTFAPIHWAVVDLYQDSWSGWDYIGTWPVNRSGYTTVYGGHLHHDGCCGVEERDFLVEVHASGYYSEAFEIELSYRHPSETLYFYLVPWDWREGRSVVDEEGEPPELPVDERPPDRVQVGEPKQRAPEQEN